MVQTTYTQGTTAIDKTREADNKYQLNTIDGNTGWTLLSEMGKQVLVEDVFLGAINNLTGHTVWPINVLNGSWATSIIDIWKINNSNEAHAGTTNLSIASINLLADGELKAFFRISTLGGNNYGGIVFRYNSLSSYWRLFYDNNDSNVKLEVLGTTIPIYNKLVDIGTSNIFVLKVLLKGNFISVFFNDLLLWTLCNNYNVSSQTHGMISNNSVSMFFCNDFKFIK